MAQNPHIQTSGRNPSLMLTKHVDGPLGAFKTEDKFAPLQSIASCMPPTGYEEAYTRWKASVENLPGATLLARFSVDGRLVIGLGSPNVFEISHSMNRLWGMPILPGTGLKGLANHYAHWLAKHGETDGEGISKEQLLEMFGSEVRAGCVDFMDAWYVPENHRPFKVDVVTPHYSAWYQDHHRPPTGFQDPIPSYFLSVRGSFLVAIHAPDQDWAAAAMELLQRAADGWGVGAKTNAGYGYLKLENYESEWMHDWIKGQQADADAEAVEAEATRVLCETYAALENYDLNARTHAGTWIRVWSSQENQDIKLDLGKNLLRRFRRQPRAYYELSGILLGDYTSKKAANPKDYMMTFLSWMEEYAPEEFQ